MPRYRIPENRKRRTRSQRRRIPPEVKKIGTDITKAIGAAGKDVYRACKPKTIREVMYFLAPTLALSAVIGAGWGMDYLDNNHPNISRKIRSAVSIEWGEKETVDNHKTTIDIKKDGITLDEIIRQTVFTTSNGKSAPRGGFIYLTTGNTTRTIGDEYAYMETKTRENVNVIRNNNGIIRTSIGDEGEGGKVIRTDINLPSAEAIGKYYEGVLCDEIIEKHASFLTENGELPDKRTREENIRHRYREAAKILSNLEIEYVFGPVIDITHNRDSNENPISALDRSYSENPDTVIALARMYIEAMHENGIKVIGKHYFGTGFPTEDPHDDFPTLDGLTEKHRRLALKPFRELAGSLDGIMVTHIENHEEGIPDSLSPEAYKYIRNNIGFRGIIITDDMCMGAIEEYYTEKGSENWLVDASIDALVAGADAVIVKDSKYVEDIVQEISRRMNDDPEFKTSMMRKFLRMMDFKDIRVKGLEEISGIEGEQGEYCTWVKRRVKKGETLLDMIAVENPEIAGYNSRGNAFIRDKDAYDEIVREFTEINGIHPTRMKYGRSYYVPDFTNDGIIPQHVIETEEPQTIEVDGVQVVSTKLERGQTLYGYFVGEGILVHDSEGRLLPITRGELEPHYRQFKQDNPNVTNPRKLIAGQNYNIRDHNRNGQADYRKPRDNLRR